MMYCKTQCGSFNLRMLQACHLQQSGSLMELVDETLRSEVNMKEAEIMVKVALLCTNASPTLRPTMSEAVSMLEGRMAVPDKLPELSSNTEDLRFKAMRDLLLKCNRPPK